MSNWLKKSKNHFGETLFSFLWNQWSLLGVAGEKKRPEDRVIDPEALLLFSMSLCRYDARLFDEIIDWLFVNGQLINVQRLKQMQKKYQFSCGPQISAAAQLLAQNATYKLKWTGLSSQNTLKRNEPLFFDKEGTALPFPEETQANPVFLRNGLFRGQLNLRGNSGTFDSDADACLLLRLRSLIGINARAEILCLLSSIHEVHPSEAARKTSYYQKTVQTILVEMARSGIILTRTSKKEKFYRLKSGTLDALLQPNGHPCRWVQWPNRLKAAEIIWIKLVDLCNMELDELLLISELKQLIKLVCRDYSDPDTGELCELLDTSADKFPVSFPIGLDRFARCIL